MCFNPDLIYLFGTLGDYALEDLNTPGEVIRLKKGDVSVIDEGTVVKGSTPSKARGE